MLEETPNDLMSDRMNIWTTIGGYGAGTLIFFLIFYTALAATSSLN